MAALSPGQAEVLVLRVVARLSVEDVAQILGKRPGTVRVMEHRALRRLGREGVDHVPTQDRCNALDTFDDLEDMAPPHLDAITTEFLITGEVEIEDAPPGFDRVAALINKVQGPATAGELAG